MYVRARGANDMDVSCAEVHQSCAEFQQECLDHRENRSPWC